MKIFAALVVLLTTVSPCLAALYDRGNGLIYDDVLDITWLQDAEPTGSMTWDAASQWVSNFSYAGFNNWRLPSASLAGQANCAGLNYDGTCSEGYNNTIGELGYMFHVNLGNLALYDVDGSTPNCDFTAPTWCLKNTSFVDAATGQTVFFNNLNGPVYFYSEYGGEDELEGSMYYQFITDTGQQIALPGAWGAKVWAVHDGDIGASLSVVPLPAAAWFFISGIAGLTGWRKMLFSK